MTPNGVPHSLDRQVGGVAVFLGGHAVTDGGGVGLEQEPGPDEEDHEVEDDGQAVRDDGDDVLSPIF